MVDSVIGAVLENINSLVRKEFGLIWGVDREMRRLSSTLFTIRNVLEDAEVKQFKDKAIRGWLKELKDAAYDADDILDECAAKALQFEEAQIMRNCSNLTCNQVTHSSFLSWFNFEQLMFRRKIGQRIKDIRERFDDIADERSKFHLNPRGIVVQSPVDISSSDRETSPIPTESQVYGRDEDKEEIVKLLLNNISNPNLLVYPILGMGGLGKTTLAQLVYNDERVEDHFEARIWVCVSDDFDVKRLTRAIIEAMGGTVRDLTGLGPMQGRLREMLGRKRFLLVLDDVWEEDENKWERLKCSLTNGIEGCSIIVTTRIEKVASIMGTLLAHYHLKGLSEKDCWTLFKQRAFGVGRDGENANLVEIGKEIVKKCGGVPLAAKALGSLMRFKRTETEWQFVRDSEIWDLPEEEENTILPALRLSYNHLPSHLRQCFAYCSIFPKDYQMEKEMLVHLWMANGFIPSKGKMELEDIGNEIFNELLWRSFFQEEVEKYDECRQVAVVYCKMHDLVHDLACSVMDNECLSLKSDGMEKKFPEGIRYVSLELKSKVPTDGSLSSLRTLLILQRTTLPHEFKLSNLKCLRALDLSLSGSSNRLSSVASLIHLRYLNLSQMDDIRVLPESLTDLKHLQTLILRYCRNLEKLPAQMSSMSSLRHLDITDCYCLSHMPKGIGQLIHLQALSTFVVGKKSSGCAHISELQGLNNLRGHLRIKGLENVKNSMEVKEVNLVRKRNLDSLTLSWPWSCNWSRSRSRSPNIDEEVLQGLQPPAGSIKVLRIVNYEGMKFPSWMEMGDDLSLQNLVRINLIDCNRCERLPPLGNLPLLKFLEVREMDSVRYLSDGLGNVFPSLEELHLRNMKNLEELLLLNNNININIVPADDDDDQEGIRGRQVAFPCLVKMEIENCDKLTTLTPLVLPSLEYLFFGTGNENVPEGVLQIRNLPVLQTLDIANCHKLVTLPRLSTKLLGELDFIISSISVLEISCCDVLKSLWGEDETQLQIQGLSSLKELRIGVCHSLESPSGLRYLTALEKLSFEGCGKLQLSQVEDFRYLTSLRQLEIKYVPKLICLPESLKHATMLQHLHIHYCKGLIALPVWIHNLTSLRSIQIRGCESLTFLPDGLLQLTALQTLEIDDCHVDLGTRCKEGGEDWHKISHIPKVTIRSREPPAPAPPPTLMRQIHRCWSDLLESRRRRRTHINQQ